MKLKVIYHRNDYIQFESLVNEFLSSNTIVNVQYKLDGSSCYAFIHYMDL